MDRPYCCARCGETHIVLRRFIITNGTTQIRWFCPACNRDAENPAHPPKHSEVTQYIKQWEKTLSDIPVAADYSDRQPCVICGAPGEYHHWAPQALADGFGDEWPMWPGTPLCRDHHMLWHHVVTPSLNGG